MGNVLGRERERARPSAQGEYLSLSVYLPDSLLACQPCWHGPAAHAGRLYRSAGTGAVARSALLRPDPCGTAAPSVPRSSAAAGRAAPCRGLGGIGGLLALPRGAPCSPISQSCPLVLRTLGGISRSVYCLSVKVYFKFLKGNELCRFPPETKQRQTHSNSQQLLTTRIRSPRHFPSRHIHSEQRRGLTPSPVDPCIEDRHQKLFPGQIPLLRCRR